MLNKISIYYQIPSNIYHLISLLTSMDLFPEGEDFSLLLYMLIYYIIIILCYV